MSAVEAKNLNRGDNCEVFIGGEWHPALFIAVDFFGNEPIVQRPRFMPTFATWGTLRVPHAAIKAAQPEPMSDEQIEKIYDETAGAMGDDYAHAGWLAFARAILAAAPKEP